jgi:PAS domain S-box-containing protein
MMEDHYHHLFDETPGYLTVQDRDFKITEANNRFKEDFGDFHGRHCYQVYKHRSEKCEICPVEKTFRDGQSHSSQESVTCLDGKDISVITYTTPVRDENGEITSVMEMSTDITDIKLLQEQVKQSQERYRLLFEEVPCYITIQDRELNLIEANRRFREDFGDYLGCKCHQVYKHREEECVPCSVMQTFNDGQVHHSEEVVTSRTGEQINTLVYSAPLYNAAGEIQAVMEMSTNITLIRQLQSQLESTGILVSTISHGIKGLLTGLDGGMYLVNSGLEKDNTQRIKQGWEMVTRNVERIRSSVLNILYYAKEREPNYETISAVELGQEVLGVVESRASENDIVLKSDFDSSAGDFSVDPRGMRSLLINLMENALDACRVDKKKTEHQVALRMKGEPEHIQFEVDDNGIGMDRETREKVFSLFFSSKGTEGTGLGLFIANNIAQAHSGSIEVESEVDKGTRFIVRILRKQAH